MYIQLLHLRALYRPTNVFDERMFYADECEISLLNLLFDEKKPISLKLI